MTDTQPHQPGTRSIGALLAAAREAKGIPVELAAKETRIRVGRIRDMENEDFSRFSNPSYARMFLIAYAKYLGVPQDRILDYLPEPGQSGSDGYAYIHARSQDLPTLRPVMTGQQRKRRSRLVPLLLSLAILAVLASAAGLWIYLSTNLPRLAIDERRAAVEAAPPDVVVPELENLPSGETGSAADPFVEKIDLSSAVAPGVPGAVGDVAEPPDFSADELEADALFLEAPPLILPAQPVDSPAAEADDETGGDAAGDEPVESGPPPGADPGL